jgi:bifunctional UDP-N-acetylglucosamine pyrophosphorylase/glucosamine-1-phosphate N-acetyltransferase
MVESFVNDFIVLSGDTIFGTQDIKNIIKKEISLGLFKVENAEEYGIVEIKNGKVIKIYEKMKQPISNIINAGIYHFNKDIFNFIRETKKSQRGEYEITDSINLLLNKKGMDGIILKEWKDVVFPWHLLDANEEILKKSERKIDGKIENNTIINGTVIIGKDSIIRAGSYIEGPVVIGNNCKIGPNCYIRPYTAIGDNCHIGNASEVKNSIVMDNSNAPHQNYVGDSIIGYNCNLGAGTKIANLRLDKKNIYVVLNGNKIDTNRRKFGAAIGDNVQTGINSTINIGTIIGNNCFLGQASSVKGEITPKSKIL